MRKVLSIVLLLLGTSAQAADWPPKTSQEAYKAGIQNYYEGLCYAARPDDIADLFDSWERGFRAAQRKDHSRVDRSHCRPGSGK